MLSNRFSEIHVDGQKILKYRRNDGLPQGSELALLLFNVYMSDLPETSSKTFIYADDIALTFQSDDFGSSERRLKEDLKRMDMCFKQLSPNITKSQVAFCILIINKQTMHHK